jgi:hypothetical protein
LALAALLEIVEYQVNSHPTILLAAALVAKIRPMALTVALVAVPVTVFLAVRLFLV